MMNCSHFRSLAFTGIVLLAASSSFGSLIYDAAFNSSEIGFRHTISNPPASGPQSVSGPNYAFGYAVTPLTDTTENFMITSAGKFSTSDFGGEAFLRSDSIDVSALTEVNIAGAGSTFGASVFNAASEDFNWFYSLDDGSDVAFGLTSSDGSLNSTLSSLNVAGSNALTVGFRYNINGAGDGFDVTSLTVSAVPEPRLMAPLMLVVFSVFLMRFKRRKNQEEVLTT